MKQQRLLPDRWRLYWTSDRIPGVHCGDIVDRATAEAWVDEMNRETRGMGCFIGVSQLKRNTPPPRRRNHDRL